MADEKKKGEKTNYAVLRVATSADGDSPALGFVQVEAQFSANNTDQATRLAAEKHGGGGYIAVPARSFKVKEYEIEQTPRAVLKK